jgi:dissimilatory sulfite reductase (desulfoviridin) alpha/beta subunit
LTGCEKACKIKAIVPAVVGTTTEYSKCYDGERLFEKAWGYHPSESRRLLQADVQGKKTTRSGADIPKAKPQLRIYGRHR